MKEKLYIVYHVYDVDGGFGDAMTRESPLFVATESVAKQYCEKWDNEHTYEFPYCELRCGFLYCKELPVEITESDIDKPPHVITGNSHWAFDKHSESYCDVGSTCYGCRYFEQCGDYDRREKCDGYGERKEDG